MDIDKDPGYGHYARGNPGSEEIGFSKKLELYKLITCNLLYDAMPMLARIFIAFRASHA